MIMTWESILLCSLFKNIPLVSRISKCCICTLDNPQENNLLWDKTSWIKSIYVLYPKFFVSPLMLSLHIGAIIISCPLTLSTSRSRLFNYSCRRSNTPCQVVSSTSKKNLKEDSSRQIECEVASVCLIIKGICSRWLASGVQLSGPEKYFASFTFTTIVSLVGAAHKSIDSF